MTGEKSFWLSLLLIPFACRQSKSIYKQWEAGCRMFDLRTKKAFGLWRGAHGWWYTAAEIEDTLEMLNKLSNEERGKIEIALSYEGRSKNATEFRQQAKMWKATYKNLVWANVSAKYSDNSLKENYKVLIPADKGAQGGVQSFLPLDVKHWQTLIPIPWLWKLFYFRKVEFNTEQYQFVDFL